MDFFGLAKLYRLSHKGNNKKNREVTEPVEIPAFYADKIIKGNNKNAGVYLAAYQMLLYEQKRRPKADSGVCIVSFPVTCRDDILGKQVGDVILPKNHSRNRRLLEECGVIWLYEKGDRNKHICDRFYWSIENEQKFIEHCKKYFSEEQLTYIIKEEERELLGIRELDTLLYTWPNLPKEVNLSQKYKCPKDMPVEQFKKYLISRFVHDNKAYNTFYELLSSTPSLLENTYFPNVKTERNRYYLTIRLTNEKCNLPTKEKEHDTAISYYREDYNDETGYVLYGDVKSSVPRVLDRLLNGTKVPFNKDYYEMIYKNWLTVLEDMVKIGSKPYKYDDIVSILYDEHNWSLVRNFIKAFCLPAIFEVSDVDFSKNVIRRIDGDRHYLNNKKQLFVPQVQELEKWKPYLETLWFAVHEIIDGGNASVFFHESNIMILVNKWLNDLGYETWICYDAIYAKKENTTQEEFNSLFSSLYEQALEVYSDVYWHNEYNLNRELESKVEN